MVEELGDTRFSILLADHSARIVDRRLSSRVLHRHLDRVKAIPGAQYVEELSELDGLLLRIALANTGRPPLLVVGNLEQVTNDRHRDVLVTRLVELGRTQTVVTASVNGVHDHPVRHLEVPNASRTELAGVQEGGE